MHTLPPKVCADFRKACADLMKLFPFLNKICTDRRLNVCRVWLTLCREDEVYVDFNFRSVAARGMLEAFQAARVGTA